MVELFAVGARQVNDYTVDYFPWQNQNAAAKNSDGCYALVSGNIPDMQSS